MGGHGRTGDGRIVPLKKKKNGENIVPVFQSYLYSCQLGNSSMYLGIGIDIFWPNLKSGIRMTKRKQRNVGFES